MTSVGRCNPIQGKDMVVFVGSSLSSSVAHNECWSTAAYSDLF